MSNSKPNILIIWGDDIGISNLSCYSDGLMGYRTPNIDRVAKEGMRFIHYYGEQSCTAGRAAFITGQSVYRTGLSKVGLPGAALGFQAEDPSIAELLKPSGYRTGQFGKNHFGDRDEHLPTMHGFDEFFGNLYHLNAEEEPEHPDYPNPEEFPEFRRKYGPRGVLHCWANEDGTQRIEDTGPLTKKRMETIDDEFLEAATGFIRKQKEADTPFFLWFNTSHMHFRTHCKPESKGQAGRWQSEYHDTMIDHDKVVGQLLDLLDELRLTEDTIVMYSTDNGPHINTWPDAGMTPFRNEKNSNWEGAYRVPAMVRWPGKIEAGSVCNSLVSHLDWLPTLLVIAGEPEIKNKLLQGHQVGDKTFKIHLDGYNMLDYWMGKTHESPRKEFFYFSDDGDLTALRDSNAARIQVQKPLVLELRDTYTFFTPVKIVRSASPDVRRRSHTITAEVEIPENGAEGVIVSNGSPEGGYTLCIKDNRLIYVSNYLGRNYYMITSNVEVPKGTINLRFEFKKTGDLSGQGTLYLNDRPVGETAIERTNPAAYAIAEGLEIGSDGTAPVWPEYHSPFTFTGIIKKVEIGISSDRVEAPEVEAKVFNYRQ